MMNALGGRGTLGFEPLDGLPAEATPWAVTLGFGGIGPIGIKMTEFAMAFTVSEKREFVASLNN